jgi:hypothetical protein
MPEHLVVDLIATECQIQCKRSEPRAQKRQVLRAVGKTLGVSEYALVMRILELPALLAVLFRAQWNSNGVPSQVRLSPAVCTKHSRVEVVNGEYLDPGIIENADEWVHSAEMQTTWGRRLVHCYAWRRPALLKEQGDTETWALGWTWNTNPIPSWDDSLETAETIRAIPRSLASRAAF